jgi:hypothetical protein
MKRELFDDFPVDTKRRAKLEGGHSRSSCVGDAAKSLLELDKSLLQWPDAGEFLMGEEVHGGGAVVQEALVKVIELGDAICAELAIRHLSKLVPLDTNILERAVRAVARPLCPATVLQQAFRSFSFLPEVSVPLVRLALEASRDARPATRVECLRVLAQLGVGSQTGLEEGLRQFAGEDANGRVRAAAIDGIMVLHQRGESRLPLAAMWETALMGLGDDESCVRKSSLKLFWLLATQYRDEEAPSPPKWRLRDRVFVLMCAGVLDASLSVREAAATLLGTLPAPNHNVMMQSLSKKNLLEKRAEYGGGGGGEERLSSVVAPVGAQWGSIALQDQQAVGAFVHALEEEFAEVRLAALESMCNLSPLYAPFAAEALEHIVDMLHDESGEVRLRAIHSLRRMGAAGDGTARLRAEHLGLLMFLLSEANTAIRRAVQQLLQEVLHPDTTAFRNTVVCLCGNFVRYPEDFEHVLASLVGLGKRHAVVVELLVEQLLGLDHPGFLVQERTIADRQYVAVLVMLLSAASVNARVMSHVPVLSLKHADYLKLKYARLFGDEESEIDASHDVLVDKDATRAVLLLAQGNELRRDALLVFERHVIGTGRKRFASVWIAAVHAWLVAAPQEELLRCLFELEFGYVGLPEHMCKRISEMRTSLVLSPSNFLSDCGRHVRPITGQILAVSSFGVEYLGVLPYPVEVRGAIVWPDEVLSPGQFAVLCVFPDRSFQLVEISKFERVADAWEFAVSTNWTVKNSAWSESCCVFVTLVRRFTLLSGGVQEIVKET